MVVGLQTWIWRNNVRTFLLVASFFLVLFLGVYGFLMMGQKEPIAELFANGIYFPKGMGHIMLMLFTGISVLFLITISAQRKIIFSMTGAKEVTRKQNPALYNLVENLCISRGLPVPKIAIIPSPEMNAFASGWSPKKSWVVVSQGLLDGLKKKELQAVLAHEITHIINRDVRLMTCIAVFIGSVALLGEILIYSRSRSEKSGNGLMIAGFGLLLLSWIIFPLIRLAVSRKREFLADAGAVELTKDRDAMISALQAIAHNPKVAQIKNGNIQAMCIAEPVKQMFSTHPSIAARVEALRKI